MYILFIKCLVEYIELILETNCQFGQNLQNENLS